jgi:hypothetical protein
LKKDLGIIKWVYSDSGWSYRDIYRNFPFVIESITGLEIINNTVFLATDNGLLKADILGNLKDPNSWTLVSNDFNGSIGTMCQTNNGFAFTLNENIYKVFYNNGSIQYDQLDIQMPVNFTDMLFDEEEFIWGIHNRNVYSQKNDFAPIATGKTLYTISSDNQGNVIIGSELGLIVIHKISHEKNVYIPNSPATGKFSALKVLSDGRLVGASSRGLSIKDFDGWRNI